VHEQAARVAGYKRLRACTCNGVVPSAVHTSIEPLRAHYLEPGTEYNFGGGTTCVQGTAQPTLTATQMHTYLDMSRQASSAQHCQHKIQSLVFTLSSSRKPRAHLGKRCGARMEGHQGHVCVSDIPVFFRSTLKSASELIAACLFLLLLEVRNQAPLAGH
jgi:hypothetical protein